MISPFSTPLDAADPMKGEPVVDYFIPIPGTDRWKGDSIQWSRQAVVALSLHLIAWPERDVPHWFTDQAQENLACTPPGTGD